MSSPFRFHRREGRQGRSAALLIVMGSLVFISALLIAFLSSVATDRQSAHYHASGSTARLLANSTVDIVMGQIRDGTKGVDAAGKTLAWASQPGMIRTYNVRGQADGYYKLYSWAGMAGSGPFDPSKASETPPADWFDRPALYTDLNEPVSGVYPVVDPAATNSVQGFAITNAPVARQSPLKNAAPMPVQWLYVLQDGTLASATAAGAGDAVQVAGASTANPIVGRIAFWTDDETCKINVNTAGAASSWNTPRSHSTDDVAAAQMQPATGEFERYPGHPAGVSLDLLFGQGTKANLSADALLGLTPRYNAGGSDFGSQATSATSDVLPKTDRLYGSVDELCFGPTFDSSGQRKTNPLSTAQINLTRFVLTAHSHAPETTLLGEPRVAIWPVSDSLSDSTRATAADRAVAADATIGTADYFFQRHNAASATEDLDPSIVPGNAALFSNLVAAGSEQLPGFGSTYAQKYPGAQWPQLVLEMLDAIRGFNAVDPSVAPFVPFAAGDGNGLGRALVVPLTATSNSTPLRGLGRYPTLCGLTLVLYVSGFGFADGTTIDYETAPDDTAGTSWQANFQPVKSPGSRWSKVNKALVRAFIVPTTFQPGCGFPEVSEACSIRIGGLDALTATSKGTTGSFRFPAKCTSPLLSDALKVSPADRAWGGFEGPVAWRAAAANPASGYPLAGTQAVTVPLASGAAVDSKTGGPSLPNSWAQTLATSAINGLTVEILDRSGATIQACTVNLPAISGQVPTVSGEADKSEASANAVAPSWYMTLAHRLQNAGAYRALMIQAGDMSYSVEARTDLRLCATLGDVPASFYGPATTTRTVTAQGGTHQHNLRFADGSSACFCSTQTTMLAGSAYANTTASFTVTDWRDGTTKIAYPYGTSPAASAPTGSTTVTMAPPGSGASAPAADWDTGPGLAPDGALANLPDAGTTLDGSVAYGSLGGGQVGAATRRSPNALLPSPVVFGSLPAGVNPAQPSLSQPWRTLLFCPYPASDQAHPGLVSPPDYLVLDRFWMPVVEPYGISTKFETAGKINLNDQIAPFTYLHRSTALRALLHGVRIPAISPVYAATYKSAGTIIPTIWRAIDEDATVTQIEKRLGSGDVYLAEGEVCSVPLVPQNLGNATPESFWTSRTGAGYLTGDNLRELPYAQIYSRLTTRSNSYTVHIRAQILKKLKDGSSPGTWREGVDRVLGEWRGSYEIERYLDPAAKAPAAGAPLGPYKFRTVSAKRFTP